MSVSAWVRDLLEGLAAAPRAASTSQRAVPAFWAAPSLDAGREQLAAFDRERVLAPLLDAAARRAAGRHARSAGPRRLAADAAPARRAARACWRSCSSARCCSPRSAARRPSSACSAPSGASTTRWSASRRRARSRSSGSPGPVGEALVMTAAGLAVAIPAVLAYNVFGKRVARQRSRARRLRARPARDDHRRRRQRRA